MTLPAPDVRALAKRYRIIAAMRAIVPGEGVITEPDELRPWESDGLTASSAAHAGRPAGDGGEAYGALALDMSSRAIAEIAVERQRLILTVAGLDPAGIVPVAGSVLIRPDGETMGAVGVTGGTSDNDEKVALAGIAAAGFST